MGKSLEKKALEEANEIEERSTQTRNRAALALRMAGASYQQIADIEDFATAHGAQRAVEMALASTVEEGKDTQKQRALTSARLDRMMMSLWDKALDKKNPEQVVYSRAVLSIIDRQAKLHGLDAPQRVEVYTPDAEEKMAWLDQMTQKLTEDTEQEADIMDAEIVDG